ncbi:5325_t:CDS:1, partial [Entrophospora sp. SA101]
IAPNISYPQQITRSNPDDQSPAQEQKNSHILNKIIQFYIIDLVVYDALYTDIHGTE